MMNEAEYWKNVAMEAVNAYVNLDNHVKHLNNPTPDEPVSICESIRSLSNITSMTYDEVDKINIGLFDEAYKIYVDEHTLKIFEVTFSGNFSGVVSVRAKNEDEARDYVSSELICEANGNEIDVYLSDDEMQEDDPVIDDYTDYCVDDANDTGEIVEDDE